MADMEIIGLSDVNRMLVESPSLIAAKALGPALDRGAGVIAAEVEARCPTTYLAGNDELREAVVVATEVNIETKGGTASVGFSSKRSDRTGRPMDAIALWVEYGHQQLTHDGFMPKTGKTEVPAHPFMRPAFDASGDRAMEVFSNALIDGLTEILPTEE